MGQITKTVLVDAPIAKVWEAVADVGYVHNWHPRVAQSPVLSPKNTGVGAKRRCDFYDGTSVVEEIIAVREGEHLGIELSEYAMPFSFARASIDLEPLSDDRTRVTFSMDFAMKYGPVGWLMEAAMVRPMMTRMFGQVLAGLNHHLVTGEYVGENASLEPAAA